MKSFSTLDAHVAGEAVRLIVSGAPSLGGRTMMEKRERLRRQGEALRRALMLEPRGHAGMHGVLITEPVAETAQLGLLFMHAAGFPLFSGESVAGAVALALANRTLHTSTEDLRVDTPGGQVGVRAGLREDGTGTVELAAMPSFVLAPAAAVRVGSRAVRLDVAFGGELYAIVDSESVGVPVDAAHAHQLVRLGREIMAAIEESAVLATTGGAASKGVQGVVFTAPSRSEADLRTATVLQGGVLQRSPGLASICAVLAVLDAMGIVAADRPFTTEGIAGTTCAARVIERRVANDTTFVHPAVQTTVWPTGRHEFVVHDELTIELNE